MSTPHRATAEEWSQIEKYAATDLNDDYAICLLNIRARVEALEEAENDRRFEQAKAIIDKPAPAPAGSLVERVASAIDAAPYDEDRNQWDPEARAAIHAVAAWLRTQTDLAHGPRAAEWLEQEVERG